MNLSYRLKLVLSTHFPILIVIIGRRQKKKHIAQKFIAVLYVFEAKNLGWE